MTAPTESAAKVAPLAPAALPQAADDALRGILYIVVATAFFGVMDASIKWLAESYSVIQVTFFRALFGLLPLLPVILRSGGGALRMHAPGPLLMRSLLSPLAMLCIFGSFHLLPLAEATIISFGAPILMAALAVPLLGEAVGLRRWAAIGIGFIGVLMVVRPDGMTFSLGAGLALAGMVLYSLLMVWGRRLLRTETPTALAFYAMGMAAAVTGVMLPWVWQTPTLSDLGIMVMMGMAGGIAVVCLTHAYRLAPIAVLAPFDYLNLPVATFTGWLIWHEMPREHVWYGATVIIASGLYIVYREHRLGRAARPA